MSKITVVSVLLVVFVLAEVNAKFHPSFSAAEVRSRIVSDLVAPANRLISVNYDTRYNPAFLGLGNLFDGSSEKKEPKDDTRYKPAFPGLGNLFDGSSEKKEPKDDSVKDGASTKKDEGIANDQRNGENQED